MPPKHIRANTRNVTRTVLTLCTTYTFLIEGPRAVRSLVALRRLPPAPPDTLARAAVVVLGIVSEDRSALYELCDPVLHDGSPKITKYACYLRTALFLRLLCLWRVNPQRLRAA